jgi:hypothetical protein
MKSVILVILVFEKSQFLLSVETPVLPSLPATESMEIPLLVQKDLDVLMTKNLSVLISK